MQATADGGFVMKNAISRRRAFSIFAGTAAAAALGLPVFSPAAKTVEWQGLALGAQARIVLSAEDKTDAQEAIDTTISEISRLEKIFSLFIPDSELVVLNKSKYLNAPSHDMKQLIALSQKIHKHTDGLFNPAIQKLWRFYADWFSQNKGMMPDVDVVDEIIKHSDFRKVIVNDQGLFIDERMELSLNGIAQGYITDRIAELLREKGWSNVLLDIGEVRSLDGKPDGNPWQVAIRESNTMIPVRNKALATSSGHTLTLSDAYKLTHILNPHTGLSEHYRNCITVSHHSAAVADALSTSLFSASLKKLEKIKTRFKGIKVWAS